MPLLSRLNKRIRKGVAPYIISLGLAGFIPGCGGGGSGGGGNHNKGGGKNDKPTATKVVELEEDSINKFISYDKDNKILKFSGYTDNLRDLNPGDAIVLPPSKETPYGLLKEVKEIKDGSILVLVRNTNIEKYIKQGRLEEIIKKGSDGILSEKTFDIEIPIPKQILYDQDNNENTTTDQITLEGNIDLKMNIDLDIVYRDRELKELFFQEDFVGDLYLKLSSGINIKDVDHKITIGQPIDLGRYAASIGPVPIWITPKVSVIAGIKGDFPRTTTEITDKLSASKGIFYYYGRWEKLGNSSNSFDFSVDLSATNPSENLARAYVGAQLDIMFYDVAGPYARGNLFSELNIDTSLSPCWNLDGGVSVGCGAKLDILSKIVKEKHFADYDINRTLLLSGDIGCIPTDPIPVPVPEHPLPDLIISEDSIIAWYEKIPCSSYEVCRQDLVGFKVKNIGDAPIEREQDRLGPLFKATASVLYNNGSVIEYTSHVWCGDTLEPGEEAEAVIWSDYYHYDHLGGPNKIQWIIADSEFEVEESNENNNESGHNVKFHPQGYYN